MFTGLVSAATPPPSGFSITGLVVLVAVVAIGWPLFRRVRRTVSENRKRRWVEQGLMDPPNTERAAGEAPD